MAGDDDAPDWMIVREAHVATYASPIAGDAADPVAVGHEDPEQPGWWWCRGADGREGWVHGSFLLCDGATSRLARRYDAAELSVAAGQEVDVGEIAGGWAWCRATDGREGWLPISLLDPTDDIS